MVNLHWQYKDNLVKSLILKFPRSVALGYYNKHLYMYVFIII